MDSAVGGYGEGVDGGITTESNPRWPTRAQTTGRNFVNPNLARNRPAASTPHAGDFRPPPRAFTSNNGSINRQLASEYTASPNLSQQIEEFLTTHNIRRRLESALENKDYTGEDFIGSVALLDIWSSDRVERFLGIFNLKHDSPSIRYVRQDCVQILSLLVTVRFAHWEKFPQILQYRKDSSIPFTHETLRRDSFLGAEDYDWFHLRQDSYHPVVIEEGEIKEYPASRRLPFIRKWRVDLGEGSYGKVTKEVIAHGQFKYKDSQSTNMVCPLIKFAILFLTVS
jgi:hypothetical protein